ncbi:MAG: hypothetical protein AAGJ37_14045 [Pseudomonadota bacterium]
MSKKNNQSQSDQFQSDQSQDNKQQSNVPISTQMNEVPLSGYLVSWKGKSESGNN